MIDGLPIANIGAGGLVVLFVLAILTGRLVPRSALVDAQKERDDWRGIALTTQAAGAEYAAATKELLEHARTSDAFIRAAVIGASRSDPSKSEPAP